MSDEANQEKSERQEFDPRQLLPGEDIKQHLERLYKLGLLKFEPGCQRCNDKGCIACYP